VRMIDRTGHVELIAPETAAWAATVAEIEAALGRKKQRWRGPRRSPWARRRASFAAWRRDEV